MAQFDIYRLGDGLVVDIQSDFVTTPTRVVAPVRPAQEVAPIGLINPVVTVQGQPFGVLVQYLSAVSRADLGSAEGSLRAYEEQIKRALDVVFYGF